MGDKSRIEWTDASWNPVTGCSKVSQGCKNCYAKRHWARLAAMPNTVYHGREFEDVRCHRDRLDQPLRWRTPRRVFVNSMSDLFHESVPDAFIIDVFNVMAQAKHHVFQLLTKRPRRMRDFLIGTSGCGVGGELMPNVWLGVSVEDQSTADERIPILVEIPTAVRWISAEPLLGPVNIERWLSCRWGHRGYERKIYGCNDTLDWVIVGGESGPNARPMHPDWSRSLRDQCRATSTAYFFKQWGEWAPSERSAGPAKRATFVRLLDGSTHGYDDSRPYEISDAPMYFVGKESAGRILDGQTWDQYPI